MLKRNFTFLATLLITVSLFTSCSKKDDPAPDNTGGGNSSHLSGTTDAGTVTVDGTTTTSGLQGNSSNSSAFYMYGNNMNPPNSYPSITFNFQSRPTKDSTYNMSYNNYFQLITGNTNTSTDNYSSFSGTMVVDVNGDSFTATVDNVIVTNALSENKTVSASLTYYY